MKTDYAAQCRFFSAEDACRIALQAYFAASQMIEPPPGEAWIAEDGSPWADASSFVDAFQGAVMARIALMALEKLGDFNAASTTWNLYAVAADIEPEIMAPIIAQRDAELDQMRRDIAAEFLASQRNELPAGDNGVHNASTPGVENA